LGGDDWASSNQEENSVKFALIAAALALSASAFAADTSKAIAMTDAQMARAVGGQPSGLYIYNSKVGGNTANAPQSSNSSASVNQYHNGITICVRICN
jgi:hypothetical protein